MIVEYYTSTFNPECTWAVVDNVVVALWHDGNQQRWIDRGVYRPLRSNYHRVDWKGKPYNAMVIVDADQFQAVKRLGREAHCCCPGVACPVHGLPPGSASGGW